MSANTNSSRALPIISAASSSEIAAGNGTDRRSCVFGVDQTRPPDSVTRNSRYANRIQRQLDAAKDSSERIRIAQTLMESADRSQRGVLCEELPSYFAGDTGWMHAKCQEVDPEIAAAVTDCVLADQTADMSNWVAQRVREGFETGSPPTQIGELVKAVPLYDPD